MNTKRKVFYIVQYLFLMLSYLLCYVLATNINIFVAIPVSFIAYLVVLFIIYKIFKYDTIFDGE